MKTEQYASSDPAERLHEKPGSLWETAGAALVPLNLIVSCCALVPALLEFSTVPAFASMRLLGPLALFYGMFALIALAAIGKAGSIACVPVLAPACIMLPALLLARRLPWWVKVLTASAELGAFVLMFRTVGALHLQYLNGGFRNLNW